MPISGFLLKQSAFYSKTDKRNKLTKNESGCVQLINNLKTSVCCDSLVIMRKKSFFFFSSLKGNCFMKLQLITVTEQREYILCVQHSFLHLSNNFLSLFHHSSYCVNEFYSVLYSSALIRQSTKPFRKSTAK